MGWRVIIDRNATKLNFLSAFTADYSNKVNPNLSTIFENET